MPSKEARSKPRLPISEPVRIQCKDWDQFQVEQAENISEGGIFVQTDRLLSPGTEFSLDLHIGGEHISTRAKVIWTKEFPKESGRHSGVGARFVDLPAKYKRKLREMVNQGADAK
jgi:uncharacterized protein (TIGR02266 family)